jgi:hypothetical protein
MLEPIILTPTNESQWHKADVETIYILPTDCMYGDMFNLTGLFTIRQDFNQQIKIGSEPDLDEDGHEIWELYNLLESDYCIKEIKYSEYNEPGFTYDKEEYFTDIKTKSIFTTVGVDGYIKATDIRDCVTLVCVRPRHDFIAIKTCGEIEIK